jgi:hypothetical protein
MKISGHKNMKDFYRYIRISPEEADHKIQALWHERGNISCVRDKTTKQDTVSFILKSYWHYFFNIQQVIFLSITKSIGIIKFS